MARNIVYPLLILSLLGCASRNAYHKYIQEQRKPVPVKHENEHYNCKIPLGSVKYSSGLERKVADLAKSFDVRYKIEKDTITYSSDKSYMPVIELLKKTTVILNSNGN